MKVLAERRGQSCYRRPVKGRDQNVRPGKQEIMLFGTKKLFLAQLPRRIGPWSWMSKEEVEEGKAMIPFGKQGLSALGPFGAKANSTKGQECKQRKLYFYFPC